VNGVDRRRGDTRTSLPQLRARFRPPRSPDERLGSLVLKVTVHLSDHDETPMAAHELQSGQVERGGSFGRATRASVPPADVERVTVAAKRGLDEIARG